MTDTAGVMTPEKSSIVRPPMAPPTDTMSATGAAPLVFIDTETTSLHPNCRVWEVAMIRRDYDREHPSPGTYTEATLQLYVDIDLSHADPYALQLGGYWDRHPAGRRQARLTRTSPASPTDMTHSVSEARAATAVAELTHGAHLVAVNPAFDAERLAQMLRRHSLFPGWSHHLIDVLALASGHLRLPPPWKSDDLAAVLGVEPASAADRHTALGDARWSARIYDAVMGGGPR